MDPVQRERVLGAYAKWARSYDSLMQRTYQRVERALSRAHLLEHLPVRPEGRLLDAGGGDGVRGVEILADGLAGTGMLLDVSAEMLHLARKRLAWTEAPLTPVRGDVCRVPAGDDFFDLTVSFGGVASHCPDAERAIAEFVRVTRPGGHIVVSVDGRAVGIRTATRGRRPEELEAVLSSTPVPIFHRRRYPFDVRFFSPDEICGLLRDAGVEIISVIGKPVFTHYLKPQEVLSEKDVRERVAMALPFARRPEFVPFADQIEVIGRL